MFSMDLNKLSNLYINFIPLLNYYKVILIKNLFDFNIQFLFTYFYKIDSKKNLDLQKNINKIINKLKIFNNLQSVQLLGHYKQELS